jgi:hypothetical protein
MRIVWLVFFMFVNVLFADSPTGSSSQALSFPKPHDHTVLALDIMEKRDVMRLDYAAEVFRRRCASCHGMRCEGKGETPPVSADRLARYSTVAQTVRSWRNGAYTAPHSTITKINIIEGIFASRYMRDRCAVSKGVRK